MKTKTLTSKTAFWCTITLLLSYTVKAQDPYRPGYENKIPAEYKIKTKFAVQHAAQPQAVPAIPASAYNEDEGTVSDSAFMSNILDEVADTTTVDPGDSLNMSLAKSEIAADTMVASYFRGIYGADDRYNARKSGKKAIFLATLVGTPALSIIPAVICSYKTPSVRHLNIEKGHLSNPSYVKGYKYEAHFIKQKAIWGNYITGSVVWVGLAHFILL